jgi:hypothetical protein
VERKGTVRLEHVFRFRLMVKSIGTIFLQKLPFQLGLRTVIVFVTYHGGLELISRLQIKLEPTISGNFKGGRSFLE